MIKYYVKLSQKLKTVMLNKSKDFQTYMIYGI